MPDHDSLEMPDPLKVVPTITTNTTLFNTPVDVATLQAERDAALVLLRRFMSEPVGYRRDKDSAYDDTRKFLEGIK